jgi:hypothetical protein
VKTYKINETDCFASVAEKYGFHDADLLYSADENALLKSKRDNLHVLKKGDSVKIPEKELKDASAATGSKYTYTAKGLITEFELLVEDFDGNALSGKEFTLDIDNVITEGTIEAGLVKCKVDASAKKGRLTVWLNDEKTNSMIWPLEIGALAPFDENEGIQARLNNLGYYCGKVDGKIGKKTKAVIKLFKSLNGMTADDVVDQATKDKIKSINGL